MTKQPTQLITCPHCRYVVKARVRSLRVKPLRRCPRCGCGFIINIRENAS